MRKKLIIEEFKRNWLIASIGFVLIVVGVAILYINEGRAHSHSKALSEALAEAITFKDPTYTAFPGKSEDYEGKLLHVTGPVKIQEPVADSMYNIMVQAVKLKKIVQMYQWIEDYTENKFSEGDETSRNYFYIKDWSEQLIDSRSFHSLGHQNPRQFPTQSKLMVADKVFLGNFEVGEAVKELDWQGWNDVTSDTRPDDPYLKMHLGWYYHVEDLFEPLVGDIRVKFQFSGLQDTTYTIVGKLVNGKIQPYKSSLKREIILLAKGELSIDEIFKKEHHTVRKKTWMIRIFGFTMIFFGVIATETLLRLVFARTKLAILSPNPTRQLRSNLKVAGIISIASCVFRQSLHYLGILE